MIRRILNNVRETTFQHQAENSFYQNPFTNPETSHFSWLVNVAPCFPVMSSNISILTEPQQFYENLLNYCSTASERITFASLYFGNGKLENKLVQTVLNNKEFRRKKLKVNILIDYTRGSRFSDNSRVSLQPLLIENEDNTTVSLYHTPYLRGIMKKYMPNRWNELFGLQHMKLYIFDNTLIISGANLSNDYFTNRQDRYFIIKDKNLCDFYCGLVDKVQSFSLSMDKNNNISLQKDWKYSPYSGSYREVQKFIENAGDLMKNYLIQSRDERNYHKVEGHDTWIFPMIQMAQLGVEHDSQVTEKILSEAPENSKLYIASGYFNLTEDYADTIISNSKAECNILMAHPEANGFLGAKGIAGEIPFAYCLIADQFKNKCIKYKQLGRVKLYEYLRSGWTYHAKGLWYYPPHEDYPCLTLIGSPNFGERSVKKDLETQIAIVTENLTFKKQLKNECERLYGLGLPLNEKRSIPRWINSFVYVFRSYF